MISENEKQRLLETCQIYVFTYMYKNVNTAAKFQDKSQKKTINN